MGCRFGRQTRGRAAAAPRSRRRRCWQQRGFEVTCAATAGLARTEKNRSKGGSDPSSCGNRQCTIELFVRAKCSARACMPTFKAIVVEKSDGGQKVGLADFDEANLMAGDVDVRVEWSTVNYKDGL